MQHNFGYQDKNGHSFIPIGEKKLDNLKAPHDYVLDPDEEKIYIPSVKRIEAILSASSNPRLLEIYNSDIKDYAAFPKRSLYQSIQYCTFLPFSENYALEYQLRTQYMHNYAEHGAASHDNYKNGFSTDVISASVSKDCFCRANLPTEYAFDSRSKKMKKFTLDESMKSHLGYSFYDRFGISEEEFYRHFTKEEQDRILSSKYAYFCPIELSQIRDLSHSSKIYPLQLSDMPTFIKTSPEKLHSIIYETEPKHSNYDIEDR